MLGILLLCLFFFGCLYKRKLDLGGWGGVNFVVLVLQLLEKFRRVKKKEHRNLSMVLNSLWLSCLQSVYPVLVVM
jgi:hypothetical protein